MRLYLDDIREPPRFDPWSFPPGPPIPLQWDHVCRNAEDAINLVRTGTITFISFDHDLGDKLSGYDVAKEVERLAAEDKIPPINYSIHSGNPVGAGNIDAAMKSAHKFWNSRLQP